MGDFVDGIWTGKGIYKEPGGINYEGDFVGGKSSGKGIVTFANGNRYAGDFVDGKFSGKGIYRGANGVSYAGDFVDGKYNGRSSQPAVASTNSSQEGYVSQGGLTWMPVTRSKTWVEANSYCANTTIRGQSGWRLPTKDELRALHASGAIWGQGWKGSLLWSSTPGGSGEHYNVSLYNGTANSPYDSVIFDLTCVRPVTSDTTQQREIQLAANNQSLVTMTYSETIAAAKSKCFACHAIDRKILGPAWQDVATKYKGDRDAANKIASNITKGGMFGWNTGLKMPPKGLGANDAEIKSFAEFIAGLAK